MNIKNSIWKVSRQYGGDIKARRSITNKYSTIFDGKVYDEHTDRYSDIILKPYQFVMFDYNPKGIRTLDFYDKRPLIFVLGYNPQTNVEFGINLNYFPMKYRKQLIITLFNMKRSLFESQRTKKEGILLNNGKYSINKEPSIFLPIDIVKKILPFQYKFALRHYIPQRRKKTMLFSISAWEFIPYISYSDYMKISESKVHLDFMNFVKEYSKKL